MRLLQWLDEENGLENAQEISEFLRGSAETPGFSREAITAEPGTKRTDGARGPCRGMANPRNGTLEAQAQRVSIFPTQG